MEPTYFTCTLGQAAGLGIQQPYKTATKLVDALAANIPKRSAVAFPRPTTDNDGSWTKLVLTFEDVLSTRDNVARTLSYLLGSRLSQKRTVALLCPSTPAFLFTWLALMRLDRAVLLIAPQCQPAAIASLCKTCDVSLLLHHDDYVDLARRSSDASEGHLDIIALPLDELAVPKVSSANEDAVDNISLLESQSGEEDVAYLHHTSGTSSGMPKPIAQTHRAGVGVLPHFPEGYKAPTFTTTPLYHGGIADLFRSWTSGAMIWLFPGREVPITASNIVKCLDVASEKHRTGSVIPVRYFSSVPYVLQSMEADRRGLQYLQSMDVVGVGGAALPAEVGDRLVANDVNLISRFGSAECGFLLSSHRAYAEDKEWQHLRVASGAEKYLRFEPQSGDRQSVSELIVLPGWPHMAKQNRGDGSFATSDLFAPHPSIPNAWRYHSRADSQVTLITGKKFDPAPLEASLATSELLGDVLIFGNGQPYPGALLFRSQQAANISDADLLEQIWPQVEKLNYESQYHARMPKYMLVPMAVTVEPLEKSSKGTILRGTAEKRFAKEISEAYEQTQGGDLSPDVPDEQLESVIHEAVSSVVAGKGGELSNNTNLFSYGVDSVAGMQIRGRLRKLLPADSPPLPINVVEDCGTVNRLADYIRRRRHGEAETDGDAAEQDHKYMLQLLEEYSRFEPPRSDSRPITNGHSSADDREVVVLTGATGALGAHLLDQYRRASNVGKIYCLVRGADHHAAFERVSKALIARKLLPLDRPSPNGPEVTVFRAALGEPRLGLVDETYDRLARETTVIMHVAWSVNFRMKLCSFVKDNIAGVRHLLGLALSSARPRKPVFAFCSSVASAMAFHAGKEVPEEILWDPSCATALGYSQSKLVAEQVLARFRERLPIRIFRVGQLAGDTEHGVWNEKEAWPMMLSAVKITRFMPRLEGQKLDWLPVDMAATALMEGAKSEWNEGCEVYHVLNENETPTWAEMLQWLGKWEQFEIVDAADWVRRLQEAVEDDGQQHPASQLLDHWRKAYVLDKGEEKEQAGRVKFAMEHTKASLPVLRNVRPVYEAYFDKLWKWITENV